MKKIPWSAIQKRVMRLPSFAAEYAFPFTLLLIAVAGVFSLAIFYMYGFSVQTKYVEQGTSLYDVKEELFQDMIGELGKRAQSLENAGKEISGDIFNPTELTGE